MGHIILFENTQLRGAHRHVVADEPDLAAADDSAWNDRVSSFAIISGTWQFFQDSNYQNPFPGYFGPGVYVIPDWLGVTDNALSSLKQVSLTPTINGDAASGFITLFEHDRFRGTHRHVFLDESDLSQADRPPFNDMASSVVVQRFRLEQTAWQLFGDANFVRPYASRLGLGVYPSLSAIGFSNDDASSLRASAVSASGAPVIQGEQGFGHVILFENENFRGAHKHVYKAEENLGDPTDNTFQAKTSSFWIDSGAWAFYRQANFGQILPFWNFITMVTLPQSPEAPPFLPPAGYPSCQAALGANDVIMSLRPPLPDLYFATVDDTVDPQTVGIGVISANGTTAPNVLLDGVNITSQLAHWKDYGGWAGFWGTQVPLARGQAHAVVVNTAMVGPYGSQPASALGSYQTPLSYTPGDFQPVVPGLVGRSATIVGSIQIFDSSHRLVFSTARSGTGTVEFFTSSTQPNAVLLHEYGVGGQTSREAITPIFFDPSTGLGTARQRLEADRFQGVLSNSPDGKLFTAVAVNGISLNFPTFTLHFMKTHKAGDAGTIELTGGDIAGRADVGARVEQHDAGSAQFNSTTRRTTQLAG